MKISDFKRIVKLTNGFYLTDDVIMFRKPVELWNEKTNESVKFKSIDEALEYKLDGIKVKDMIANLNELVMKKAS